MRQPGTRACVYLRPGSGQPSEPSLQVTVSALTNAGDGEPAGNLRCASARAASTIEVSAGSWGAAGGGAMGPVQPLAARARYSHRQRTRRRRRRPPSWGTQAGLGYSSLEPTTDTSVSTPQPPRHSRPGGDKRSILERLVEFISPGPDSRAELLATLADAEERELIEPESRQMLEGVLRMAAMGAGDAIKLNHYFTSPHTWFVRTNIPNGRTMFWREKPLCSQDNDWDTKNSKAATYMRFSRGNTDPR